jgi:hypothetical protein
MICQSTHPKREIHPMKTLICLMILITASAFPLSYQGDFWLVNENDETEEPQRMPESESVVEQYSDGNTAA